MRVAGEAIARQAGIENGDLAAGTAELQGGGEAGKAAADDDDVIHGDGLRIVDAVQRCMSDTSGLLTRNRLVTQYSVKGTHRCAKAQAARILQSACLLDRAGSDNSTRITSRSPLFQSVIVAATAGPSNLSRGFPVSGSSALNNLRSVFSKNRQVGCGLTHTNAAVLLRSWVGFALIHSSTFRDYWR